MAKAELSGGPAHDMPRDLAGALNAVTAAKDAWESLTPLARNEWICWNISVKQEKTRKDHIARTVKELQDGKRRPCCWIGCIHRKDKPISKTQKWVLSRKSSQSN